MKLYVYDHCPFCVRARMIFGLKNLPVELIVLANDDEATPIGLVGKKVVPILVKEDGTAMPESLDIVHYVDEHFGEKILSEHVRPEIEAWLKVIGDFAENIAKTEIYLTRLKGDLEKLAVLIQSENALNGQLSLEDIIVFPVLRNLTCVKGIEFPPAVLAYITNMAKLSNVPLYFDKAI